MSTESLKGKQIPIVEGLFTYPPDEPRIIGGRCKSCGTVFFPKGRPVHRPGCREREVEEILLSKKGKLTSYSWHHYQPPRFRMEPFAPYGIGLVDLPEGIRVVGVLTGMKEEEAKIGMEVEMVAEGLYTDEEGNERLTWKFKPV